MERLRLFQLDVGVTIFLVWTCLISVSAEQLRKSARAYSSPSSSSNSLYGSSSSSGSYGSSSNNNYNDNFDSMFDSMDINKNGNQQKVKIALPNPPMPPKPPRPMAAPNMGNYENDPNNMPNMPRPPAPPHGFGPMDIEFQFPSYEPSVDDSFFDSDASSSLSSGSYGNSGSSSSYGNSGSSSSYGSGSSGSSGSGSYNSGTSGSSGYNTSNGTSGSGGAYGSGSPVIPAGTKCSPRTQPAVTNGACVNESLISTQCKNLQLAMSSDCMVQQFCCFSNIPTTTAPTTTKAAGGGLSGNACSPLSQPAVKNGVCVNTSVIATQCKSLQLSASSNCTSGQYCCFSNTPTATNITTRAPPTPIRAKDIIATTEKSKPIAVTVEKVKEITTTAMVSQGGSCSPLSNPSVTNGECFSTKLLQEKCGGKQMSQSHQCTTGQFCCFITAAPPLEKLAIAISTLAPVPTSIKITAPAITPALTLPVVTVTETLATTTTVPVVTAAETQASTILLTPSAAEITAALTSTEVSVGPASTESNINEKIIEQQKVTDESGIRHCHPAHRPSGVIGKCVAMKQLTTDCKSLSITLVSSGCEKGEMCCFGQQELTDNKLQLQTTPQPVQETTEQLTTQAASVAPVQQAPANLNRQCHPTNRPADVQGKCVKKEFLAQECRSLSITFAASGCNQGEMCCFGQQSEPVPVPAQEPNPTAIATQTKLLVTCRPNNKPEAHGECFKTALLSTACHDRAASKSDNCGHGEWCCVLPDAPATAPADLVLASSPAPQIESLQTAQPATDAPFTSPFVKEIAQTIQASDVSNNGLNAPSCTPNDNKEVHNGLCFTMRQLSTQCVDKKASVSKDCAFGRFCCFEDSSSASVSNNADVSQNQANKVVNVQQPQDQVQAGGSAASSSASDSGQTDSLQLAPANPNPPVTVVVASVQMPIRSCSPNSNPLVKNGHCLTIRELRASCVDQKASPSSDCDMGSWCCFNDDADKIAVEATTQVQPEVIVHVENPAPVSVEVVAVSLAGTTVTPVTVAETTAAPVTVAETTTLAETTTALLEAVTTAASGGDQQCTPNSRTEVHDGSCMPTRDLRVRCKNQRVSKSPQCKIGHWCCFTDSSNPVPVAVNELSRSINVL